MLQRRMPECGSVRTTKCTTSAVPVVAKRWLTGLMTTVAIPCSLMEHNCYDSRCHVERFKIECPIQQHWLWGFRPRPRHPLPVQCGFSVLLLQRHNLKSTLEAIFATTFQLVIFSFALWHAPFGLGQMKRMQRMPCWLVGWLTRWMDV